MEQLLKNEIIMFQDMFGIVLSKYDGNNYSFIKCFWNDKITVFFKERGRYFEIEWINWAFLGRAWTKERIYIDLNIDDRRWLIKENLFI